MKKSRLCRDFFCCNLRSSPYYLPPPLGEVAEQSEVGRGLFRQPFGLPPSPEGKALLDLSLRNRNRQYDLRIRFPPFGDGTDAR